MHARFDRPSRFKSRVPAQPLRMLLFHFGSLNTSRRVIGYKDSSLKPEQA